jgi:hypothetical protein
MKKILLISLTFLFLSCSSSSDDNSSNSSNQITPPSWIQGTWLQTMSTDLLITNPVFRFKPNDFCVLSSSLEICNAQNIQQASQAGATTNVQQTITDNEYTLSMTIQSQTTTYKFIKISNTKIEYVNPTNGLPNLPLTKQ